MSAIIQALPSNSQTIVLAYHDGDPTGLKKAAGPDVGIILRNYSPFKGNYSKATLPTIAQEIALITKGKGKITTYKVILVGFSEGCIGIRTQLLRAQVYNYIPRNVVGILALDGIHASKMGNSSTVNMKIWDNQLLPWSTVAKASTNRFFKMTASYTDIIPKGNYMSTKEAAGYWVPDARFVHYDTASNKQETDSVAGYFRLIHWNGSTAPAHVAQLKKVLPRELPELVRYAKDDVVLIDDSQALTGVHETYNAAEIAEYDELRGQAPPKKKKTFLQKYGLPLAIGAGGLAYLATSK